VDLVHGLGFDIREGAPGGRHGAAWGGTAAGRRDRGWRGPVLARARIRHVSNSSGDLWTDRSVMTSTALPG
jgi:hypothetical protein